METNWTSLTFWLLRAALGGGVILAVTLLAMRLLKQPARRQRLGELGLVAALLVATLCWAPAWVPLWTTTPAAPSAAEFEILFTPSSEEAPAPPTAPPTPIHQAPIPAIQPAPAPALDGSLFAEWLPWVMPAIVIAWGLGALFYLTRWLSGVVVLWRIVRAAQPATPELLADFRRHFGAGREPRLLISQRLRVPISCGIFRPTVILPDALTEPAQAAQREWIFAHELTHLARRDAWSALLFAAGQMVYFALPWFWWLRRQVRLCQEFVADAAAVARHPADEYAEFLLSLTATPAAPSAATGVTGAKSDLYRRVAMLLQNSERVELSCPRRWTIGVASVLLGLAVIAAGVGPAQADPPNQKEVLEQLQRIQDMVNKLRTQIAAAPNEDAQRTEVKKSVIVVEVDVGKKKEEAAAKDAQQGAEKELQKATIILRKLADKNVATADQQKQLANAARAQAELQLRLAQLGAEKRTLTDASLKHVLEILQKHLAELKDSDPATKQHVEQAIERLREVLKKQPTAVPAPPAPPSAPKFIIGTLAVPGVPAVPGKVGTPLVVEATGQPGQPMQLFAQVVAAPPAQGRLGIRLEVPSALLAEQLNLPKDQGLVVAEVFENSVAKKAGLKANDILIRLNQQAVSSQPDAIVKQLADIKADVPFDIVVIRRGKQETIPNVRLAAAVDQRVIRARVLDEFGQSRAVPSGLGGQQVNITITAKVSGTNLTLQRKDGGSSITVQAEIAGGKKTVKAIVVTEKDKTSSYSKVDDVPEAHRAKVQHLIQLLESANLQSSTQTPAPTASWRNLTQQYFVLPEVERTQIRVTPQSPGAPGSTDLYYWVPSQSPSQPAAPQPKRNMPKATEVELEVN